jgi:hypothetical protein
MLSCPQPKSRISHYKEKKKADDRIKTIAEATTHTVLTVDGCNFVTCHSFAVTDLCSPPSVLLVKLIYYTTTAESL